MNHCFECEMIKMRHIDISPQFTTPTIITFFINGSYIYMYKF